MAAVGVAVVEDEVELDVAALTMSEAAPTRTDCPSKVGIPPERLMHVGDIYEKDVEGARAAGMTPVLLDRDGRFRNSHVVRIEGLAEIVSMVTALPETKSAENGAS